MEESQKVDDLSIKEISYKSNLPAQKSTESEQGSHPAKKCMTAEIILLCVVMVVIWVALTLPLVFFYLPVVSQLRINKLAQGDQYPQSRKEL